MDKPKKTRSRKPTSLEAFEVGFQLGRFKKRCSDGKDLMRFFCRGEGLYTQDGLPLWVMECGASYEKKANVTTPIDHAVVIAKTIIKERLK